ncbi:MAG: HlyD family efflux transporter periplasmic adaptor subunit [Planctomycetota bacterium]
MRRFLVLVLVLAALATLWLIWQQRQRPPLVVSGYLEADQIRVGSRVGGRVAQVLVEEGQDVAAGSELYRIEPFDLSEQLEQAEAELAAASAELARLQAGLRAEEITQAKAERDRLAAQLAKLRAGPRPQEIAVAREQVKIATANLELAQIEFERAEALTKQQVGAESELDRARRSLKASEGELARSKQQLALLEEGTRPEEIAEAESALAEAEAIFQLRQAGYRSEEIAQAGAKVAAAKARTEAIQKALDELVVRAPSDSVVETIDLHPGDLVAANAPTMALLDRSRLRVRAFVPQAHLERVRLGARVPVRVDAMPDRKFFGTITYIATEGEFTPRNIQTPEERAKQVFRIMVTLDAEQEGLRAGMLRAGMPRAGMLRAGMLRAGMLGDVLLDEIQP